MSDIEEALKLFREIKEILQKISLNNIPKKNDSLDIMAKFTQFYNLLV